MLPLATHVNQSIAPMHDSFFSHATTHAFQHLSPIVESGNVIDDVLPHPTPSSASRCSRAAKPLTIFMLTCAAFSGALFNPLLDWDDRIFITINPAFRSFAWPNIRWMFTTFYGGPYQPLSWLSYAVDFAIFGLRPFGFHLTNVVLHAATAVAVYFLAIRLYRLARPALAIGLDVSPAAMFASLLFAIHPLRVESVAWATERRDVLSGVFYVMTFIAYLRYATDLPSNRSRNFLAALLCFALSLLAKGTGMMLPFLLLILDVYPLGRIRAGGPRSNALPRSLLEKIPFFALAITAAFLALRGQRTATDKMPSLAELGPSQRVAIASHAVCFYAEKELLPVGLSPLYELRTQVEPSVPALLPWLAAASALTVAALALARRCPAITAAWFAYLLALAPVSGLAQAGAQLVADRYSYLPCLPFAILAGSLLVPRTNRYRNAALAPVIAAVAALAVLTVRQVRFWRDTPTLWTRVIELDPSCAQAHLNLSGYDLAANRLADARRHAEEAVRLKPNDARPRQNLGVILESQGLVEPAIQILEQAAALSPPSADAIAELGAVLVRNGRYVDAQAPFERALRVEPRHAKALFGTALVQLHLEHRDAARDNFERARATRQLPPSAFIIMAKAWQSTGEPREVAKILRAGVDQNPADPSIAAQLAWLLATCPSDDVRDGRAALQIAERVRQTRRGDPVPILLAWVAALAETGRWDDARQAFGFLQNAVRRQSMGQLPDDLADIENCLRDHRPIRDMSSSER